MVDQQQATIARKDTGLKQRAAELREVEERASMERRELHEQFDRTTALLPALAEELRDARERASGERRELLAQLNQAVALVPAPAAEEPVAEQPRGFFRRVFG